MENKIYNNCAVDKIPRAMANGLLGVAYCILLIAYCPNIEAQTTINLKAAIDTALKNNLSVKNERLRTEYQQKLIRTAKIIPPANVFGEVGQINSPYVDSKFGLSQTISFPKVYAGQKSLLTEEWKSSVLNVAVKEAVLKKQVEQVYYNLLYLQEKKMLLQKTDSLFAEFLRRATLRFDKGESNILEKTTAENQRGQIGLQLSQLERDMELAQIQFQLLLNTITVFMPGGKEFRNNVIAPKDTSDLPLHPAMQYLIQQQQIATAATQVEKSKLLPDITFGYNLMSIQGPAANNKSYNSVPQFHAVQIGFGIPIFNKGQKERINAAKVNETIIANEYEVNLKNFETAYKIAIAQYQKYSEEIQYFEATALKNADMVTSTANKQFLGGDINYLEWVLLVNQAVNIQSEYIEAVRNRNSTLTEINSFINN